MEKFDFDFKHYVITQKLPYQKTFKNYIVYGSNESHIKKLLNSMVGDVSIYLYNPDDNSRKDLTKKYYTREYNPKTFKYENVVIATARYVPTEWGPEPEYFKFYYIYDYKNLNSNKEYFPPLKFYMKGYVYKLKYKDMEGHLSYNILGHSIFYSNIDDNNKKQNYGNKYENFIASKYEHDNYYVELNGIKRGVKDGGLDLIATKKDKIVLVQCKNWSLSNNYKINQKDLRAFIGDCYLYMKDRNLHGKTVAFHFIVSHNDILTKSADIFLKQNTFLKFKCVPFEK
jgi:hypothetical protein